jgi:hypothetical protein
MKTRFCLISFSMLVVVMGLTRLSLAQDEGPKRKERIGTYDSRAIAIAFAGSPVHKKQLGQLKAEHQKAKEKGELDTAAQLEAKAKAWQEEAHKQAFSTAPVDDLLAHISDVLPEIRTAAGVTAIVSKWDQAGLKMYPGAERVDVTMSLVDAFQPTERQRNSAIEIQKRKPIPLEEVERIKH